MNTRPVLLLFRSLLLIAIAVTAGLLLALHWQLINGPVVIDVFEGVQPHFSELLRRGENPYTAAWQPLYTNSYPPLYNLLCAVLLPWASDALFLHRAVSGLFIVLSCTLLYASARRAGSRWELALLGAVLLYAALQYYSTVVASSNSMGTFFFLCSVLIPWWRRFSPGSLAVSALCVSLAFFSKQYFALGLAIVAGYLVLFHSVRAGLVYGVLAGALLLASVLATDSVAPHFLDNILFAMGNVVDAIDNTSAVSQQLLYFSKYFSGLLLAAVIAGLCLQSTSSNAEPQPAAKSGGLLTGAMRVNYFVFAFLVALLAIVFVLGRNPGNYMTYLFQLMAPFFLLVLLRFLSSRPRVMLLSPLFAFNLAFAYQALPKETTPDMQGWQAINRIIASHERIFNSSILTYALMQQGKQVHNGGLDAMFRFATLPDTPLQSAARLQAAQDTWQTYRDAVREDVIQQRYDALLIQPGEINHLLLTETELKTKGAAGRFLRRYYQQLDPIELSLTERRGGGLFRIQVWIPKP